MKGLTSLDVFIGQMSPVNPSVLNFRIRKKLEEGENENIIYERLAWGSNYHSEKSVMKKFQNTVKKKIATQNSL